MNDLSRTPLTRRLARFQLRLGDLLQCRGHCLEAVFVLIDECHTLRRVHPLRLSSSPLPAGRASFTKRVFATGFASPPVRCADACQGDERWREEQIAHG